MSWMQARAQWFVVMKSGTVEKEANLKGVLPAQEGRPFNLIRSIAG